MCIDWIKNKLGRSPGPEGRRSYRRCLYICSGEDAKSQHMSHKCGKWAVRDGRWWTCPLGHRMNEARTKYVFH